MEKESYEKFVKDSDEKFEVCLKAKAEIIDSLKIQSTPFEKEFNTVIGTTEDNFFKKIIYFREKAKVLSTIFLTEKENNIF